MKEKAIYPLTIGSSLLLHYLLKNNGCGIELATYIPVLLATLVITTLELRFPYREEWKANSSDVRNDVTFMLLVQILLPEFLSFFLAISLQQFLNARGLFLENYWPHTSSVAFQAILMLLIADLFRYWLHRVSHKNLFLWRFHAVHHSSQKLYWVNVGRFHPFEKAAQYFLDALPFILLGVSTEVLALYFVFYAINGFFQHCNIKLSLGILNYLISGPELHRWHHSRKIKESDSNFGNNLIIWDLLFGTYFLPSERSVGELGTLNKNYPMDFLSQLKTPFIKGIDKAEGSSTSKEK